MDGETKTAESGEKRLITPDFYGLYDNVLHFCAFDKLRLSELKKSFGIKLGYAALKDLQKYYMECAATPTLFELKLIDIFWAESERGLRHISQIELESENPAVFKALRNYREARKRTGNTLPVTSGDICRTAIKDFKLKRGEAVKNTLDLNYYSFDSADRARRKNAYISIVSRVVESGKDKAVADELYDTVMACGGKPVALVRTEFVTDENEITTEKQTEPSGFSEVSTCPCGAFLASEFKNKFNIISSFNLHSEIQGGDVNNHDRVYLLKFPDAGSRSEFISNIKILSLTAIPIIGNYVKELLSLGAGVFINTDKLTEFDAKPFTVDKPSLLVLVGRNAHKNFLKSVADANVLLIGKIISKNKFVVTRGSKRIVDIPINVLKNATPRYIKAIINIIPKQKVIPELPHKNLKKYILDGLTNNKILKITSGDFCVGGAYYAPYGGKKAMTPAQVFAVPVPQGYHDGRAVVVSSGYGDTDESDSFVAGIDSVLDALSRLVSCGTPLSSVAATVNGLYCGAQDETVLGDILAAKLGAVYALQRLGIPTLGGEGEFVKGAQKLRIITHAVGAVGADKLINNIFESGEKLYRLPIPRDEYGVPDFKYCLRIYNLVNAGIEAGNVVSCAVVTDNIINTVLRSLVGNGNGFSFAKIDGSMFSLSKGELLVSVKDITEFSSVITDYIGVSDDTGIIKGAGVGVFQTEIAKHLNYVNGSVSVNSIPFSSFGERKFTTVNGGVKIGSPRVICPYIGVNPGRIVQAFEKAGAKVKTVKLKSFNSAEFSREMRVIIEDAEIIALSPPSFYLNGKLSGDLFSDMLRIPAIQDAVNELLYRRDGLVTGLGEGARALVNSGFLSMGAGTENERLTMSDNIGGGFYSGISSVKVLNNNSPWFSGVEQGKQFIIPISINSGRFNISREAIKNALKDGRVPTIFTDSAGALSTGYPTNPTRSVLGVESLVSSDGRICGRLGYAERIEKICNIPGEADTGFFERGVNYFK